MEAQRELVGFSSVENSGFMVERCAWNHDEAVFAQLWDTWNNRIRPFSSKDLLQDLFMDGNRPALDINDRDRYVAATLIQWLGTNVGFSFLKSCLYNCGWSLRHFPSDPHNEELIDALEILWASRDAAQETFDFAEPT